MKLPESPKRNLEHSPSGNAETVSAADRALQVLDAFDANTKSLSLSNISERTGLPKSTALRLIATLINREYVRPTPDGRYQLGPTILRLFDVYQRTVHPEDLIRPKLEELMQASGESASFNVREGDVQVCLYRVDSTHALRDHVRVGQCFSMNHGCAARVLRAFSGEAGQTFDEFRTRVVIATHGEQFPGASGIAVPVFGFNQSLAGALILSGPTTRFNDNAVTHMEMLLLNAGAELTRQLGGNPMLFGLRRAGANADD